MAAISAEEERVAAGKAEAERIAAAKAEAERLAAIKAEEEARAKVGASVCCVCDIGYVSAIFMLLVALWWHKSVWTCEMSCTLVGISCNGRSLRFAAPLAQAEAERLAKKKAEAERVGERVGMGRVCCKRCVHQLSIRAFVRLFVPQIAAEQAEAARKAAEAAKVVEYSIIHMTHVIIIIVRMFCVSSNTWDNEKEWGCGWNYQSV